MFDSKATRLAKASLAILALSLIVGCGGNGTSGGGPILTLRDTQDRAVNGAILTGRGIIASVQKLTPGSSYDFVLVGPAATQASTTPDGRHVTTFGQTDADANGTISDVIVEENLAAGAYTLQIEPSAGTRGRAFPIATVNFTVQDPAAKQKFAVIQDAQGNAKRIFTTGQDVYVRGQGFPANSKVDVYVVADEVSWETGDGLIDVSGWVAQPPPNLPRSWKRGRAFKPNRSRGATRVLSGKPKTVTTDANGAFVATQVWKTLPTQAADQEFDVVVDVNRNQQFDADTDFVTEVATAGFAVETGTAPPPVAGHQVADLTEGKDRLPKNVFAPGEEVYAELPPTPTLQVGTERWVNVYVVKNKALANWKTGDTLTDVSGANGAAAPKVGTLAKNSLAMLPVRVSAGTLAGGDYQIVLDVNRNGKYDQGIDVIDGSDRNGGTTGFRVASPVANNKKWTILAYLPADAQLDGGMLADVREMAAIGTNADINIVLQLSRSKQTQGQWKGIRRYLVGKGMDPEQEGSSLLAKLPSTTDMGKPETLRDFIQWGKQAYPADRYLLILSDHGSGWTRAAKVRRTRGICYDEDTGNGILMPGLQKIIKETGQMDLVDFDACLMGMAEVAVQLSDVVPFVTMSEELEPGTGTDWKQVLGALAANPSMATKQLGQTIVTKFGEQYIPNDDKEITKSAVDSAKVGAVTTAVDNLAGALLATAGGNQTVAAANRTAILQVFGQAQRYAKSQNAFPDYRDLVDFAKRLKAALNDAGVKTACDGVVTAVQQAVYAEVHSADLPGSNGLTMWIPSQDNYNENASQYPTLTFGAKTHWGDVLKELYPAP